jgi:hypothetical protein
MRLNRIITFLLAFHVAFTMSAIDEIKNSRIQGTDIAIGKKVSVKDDKYPFVYATGWDNGFEAMSNKGTIEFGLDETQHGYYASDFTVDVTFDVIATDRFGQQQVFPGNILNITYKKNGNYKDKAQMVFDGFVKLEVTITNVDAKNLPANTSITVGELYMEAELATSRHYLFYSRVAPASGSSNINYNIINSCNGNPAQLEVFWDYATGAEEYELEWTWVNNYTGSSQNYDFKFDATRIITKNTYYRIPLLYEGGYILYRLRHIGRGGTGFTQRVEGPWTTPPESGAVSAYPGNMKYQLSSFATDQMNWSATMTFDENAKKGSGVSFMDGMLMGRQSLAILNTEEKVIAQGVVYDNQGRPAISILPVPLEGQCLLYQNGLNKNNNNTQYVPENFDNNNVSNTCESFTHPLNVNAGAANYYSTSNADKDGAQGYLPVADGMPFVQVEYTNDMTGRIKSQTMPGEAHKLGNGKETKFYYVNPGDGELLQLFGSEVGNAQHYDKNIVSDANGQLSASYIDMEGRVVATALLGPKPASVDEIEDYNSLTPMKDIMSKYNIEDKNDYSLNAVKTIFVENAGATESFTYEFMPEDFTEACTPGLCFDCIYEVEFKITNACTGDVTTPVSVIVGKVTGLTDPEIGDCEQPSVKYELSPGAPLVVTFPEAGYYLISKTLKVSDKNLDEYLEVALANNTCIPSYNSILTDQVNAIDMSSCNTDCASCSTSVASYVLSYASTHQTPLTQDEIDILYSQCEILCLDQLDPCLTARKSMLQDFYPGGQYAEYTASTFVVSSSTSILNTGGNMFNVNYTNCSLNYKDAHGNGNVLVRVYRLGQPVDMPVCSLTVKEFVENFQPSWAEAFLNFHPERCYLDFCEQNTGSDRYDYEMLQANTYDDAFAKGFLKPIAGVTMPSSMCPAGTVPQKLDPFFTGTGFGAVTTDNTAVKHEFNPITSSTYQSYYELMQVYMNIQYPLKASGIDLFDMAQAHTYGTAATSSSSNSFGCDACVKDQLWINYRTLYMQQKMRLVSQARTDFVMKNGCFNGCMQNSGLNPFEPVTSTLPAANATSLNFIEAPALNVPAGGSTFDPFYEFFTITGYPIAKSPNTPLSGGVTYNTNLHDDFWQSQSPNSYGQLPACTDTRITTFKVKTARFYQMPFDVNGLASFYDNLLGTNSNSGPNVIGANPVAGSAADDAYCRATCESYADEWINKLKDCKPELDAQNLTYYDPVLVANIRAGLVDVCKSGCDPKNPFGASTAPFPIAGTGPGNFDSFKEVLVYYGLTQSNANCNAFLLDFPEPYAHDYSGSSSNGQNKLDTCGCNIVLKTQAKFNTLQTNGTLPSGVTTVEQYFTYVYNTPIYNYNELLCKCNAVSSNAWNATYQWSQGQSTTLLSSALPVSDVLSCSNKCLPCSTIVSAVNTFNTAFPSFVNSPNYNSLLENALNGALNMNLTAGDYLDFYNGCQGVDPTCSQSTRFSQLAALLTDFINLIAPNGSYGPYSITVSKTAHPNMFGPCIIHCDDPANGPNMVTITIPSGIAEQASFHYYGGIGDCATFDCDMTFDAIAGILTPACTNIVVTDVHVPTFNPNPIPRNLQMTITYDHNGVPDVGAAYFSAACMAGPATQLCNQPYMPSFPFNDDCYSSMLNQAETNAKLIYQSYVDKYITEFKKNYKEHCLGIQEKYERTYDLNEYHYTLYYYDQAGNLTRTVAPKGVHKLSATNVALLQGASPPVIYPAHTYVTNYNYQSYGAPLDSKTPDEAASTDYVYDNIGRIRLSANGQQKTDGKYSYTAYDELGRIIEVGVLSNLPSGYTMATLKALVSANTFDAFVNAPLTPTIKSEVIKTYYDVPFGTSPVINAFAPNGQENLRNRVADVTYEDIDDFDPATYNYATHYTYDEHGNVGRVVQDVPELEQLRKRFYKMDYSYDLISGNVNQVTYQPGDYDQFMHRYEYDADNRLHEVFTSKDNINWDKDAKYFYYEHGPLARIEVADQKVQGTDFAYTIHGWIKAVNSNILASETDMGKDGTQGNAYMADYYGVHQYIGKDAAGYSLNYYQLGTTKDYQAIKSFNNGPDKNMIASTANLQGLGLFNLPSDAPDLYNGNISSMVTSIYDIDMDADNAHAENTVFPQITGYRYDQLHRLKQMKAFREISLTGNAWDYANIFNFGGSYRTEIDYDKNGNIVHQLRYGADFLSSKGLPMDNMTYVPDHSGSTENNHLVGVNDSGVGLYTSDIKDALVPVVDNSPGTFEYTYDKIGSLISDKKEYIQAIEWTVDRKVKKVIRDGATMIAHSKNMPDLEFEYDANRQRVVKIVKPHDASGNLKGQDSWVYTYYVRDASGNIAATYSKNYTAGSGTNYTEIFTMQEHDLYGSSRLGTLPDNTVLNNRNFTATMSGGVFTGIVYPYVSPPQVLICTLDVVDPLSLLTYTILCPQNYERNLGNKRFELSNHLGNVLSVVSDRKLQVQETEQILLSNNFTSSYAPYLAYNTMNANLTGGKLNITGANLHDGAVYNMNTQTGHVYRLSFYVDPSTAGTIAAYPKDFTAGNISYQTFTTAGYNSYQFTALSNGTYIIFENAGSTGDFSLDNILIREIQNPTALVDHYMPEILETHDYYAFGMEMPGRSLGSDYKYGMNGQMKEGEVFEGFMSADYWGYDARLGRRWELDPITYSWQSGYACFNNNPIFFADPLGLEGEGGPKKGDVYNCGDGTTEVFDGTQYVSPSQYVSNLPGAQNRSFTMNQSVMSDGAISMRIMGGLSSNQKAEIMFAGMANAMSSNTMLGAGRISADALYLGDPVSQSLYLQGQIAGDLASIGQGKTEIAFGAGMVTAGEGMIVAGVLLSETGVGLIIAGGGEVVATGGELVTLHGQAVIIVASAQLVRTTVLLAAVTTHNGNEAAAKSDGGGSRMKSVYDDELPSLDVTGKVHGTLPTIKNINKHRYSIDALEHLLGELKLSVQKRIKVTSKLGRDKGHGQRQGAEQSLIKIIENYLKKNK